MREKQRPNPDALNHRKRMPFDYTPWPHLDVPGLPPLVRKFLIGTIVASLYTGSLVLIVVAGVAVTDFMRFLFEYGVTDVGNLASEISLIIRNAVPI